MKAWATQQKNHNSTLWMWENASTEKQQLHTIDVGERLHRKKRLEAGTVHIAFCMAQCVTGPPDQKS